MCRYKQHSPHRQSILYHTQVSSTKSYCVLIPLYSHCHYWHNYYLLLSLIITTIFIAKPATGNTKNLALNKPTNQSSLAARGYSRYAVDGNTTGYYFHRSCSHTREDEDYPWWMVDLQQTYTISHVRIYNRDDCCAERLQGFDVEVLNEYQQAIGICISVPGQIPSQNVTYTCDSPVTGRYVRVIKTIPKTSALTICEFEVYETVGLFAVVEESPVRLEGRQGMFSLLSEKGDLWAANGDSYQSVMTWCALKRLSDERSIAQAAYIQLELPSGLCRFLESESDSQTSESDNWILYRFDSDSSL